MRRRQQGDEPLDPTLEQLFLQSSRVPIPEQRELLRARSRVGTALARQAPATEGRRQRLAGAIAGGGRWRPALGGTAAVAVLMLAIAFSALASTSNRASANFQEEVAALVVATENALADSELDDAERTELAGLIATLIAELDSAPETLSALNIDELGAVAADLSEVREALADHDADAGESADGLSFLIVSVAEAVVSEAAGACSDAETRDGVDSCRSAFHSAIGACAELDDGSEECGDALEQAKDDAEKRYEDRKHAAESAAGCKDVAALDAELGAECAEIVEGVVAACVGDSFADCRAAFHDAKDACEALGEFAYEGCKNAAEAVKDATDGDSEDDEEDVAPVENCSELTDPELTASCQSVIDGVTTACSDVRGDEDRDACQQAFHDGKQACASLGEVAFEACKDEIEELKDAAERDWEDRKQLAEQATSCSEVAALDPAAGEECSSVTAAVAIACEGGRDACREAFQLAKAECRALGALAAEGCTGEIESLKDIADEDDDDDEKLSASDDDDEKDKDKDKDEEEDEDEKSSKGREREKPENGHDQDGDESDDDDPEDD